FIAIIAILAALLLPVLSNAKGKAMRMTCVSNLHQVSLANNMYATDSQDFMAWCNWDGGNDPAAPPGSLYTMNPTDLPAGAPGQIPDPYPNDTGASATSSAFWSPRGTGAWQTALWWRYMPNSGAYYCPADKKSLTLAAHNTSGNAATCRGNSNIGRQNKL